MLKERGTHPKIMSRIETDQLSLQDDLPPEIQRRLQVEELWARRNVLADLMNEERFAAYTRRRTDLAAAPMDAGSSDRLARLAAAVVPMKSRKPLAPRIRLGAAGLILSPQLSQQSGNHAQPH